MDARLRKQLANIFHTRATRFVMIQTKYHVFISKKIQPLGKEAREYAKSINAGYHIVSCKDCINIKELFEDCAKKYLEVNNLVQQGKNEKNRNKIVLDPNKKVDKKKCC